MLEVGLFDRGIGHSSARRREELVTNLLPMMNDGPIGMQPFQDKVFDFFSNTASAICRWLAFSEREAFGNQMIVHQSKGTVGK